MHEFFRYKKFLMKFEATFKQLRCCANARNTKIPWIWLSCWWALHRIFSSNHCIMWKTSESFRLKIYSQFFFSVTTLHDSLDHWTKNLRKTQHLKIFAKFWAFILRLPARSSTFNPPPRVFAGMGLGTWAPWKILHGRASSPTLSEGSHFSAP